MDSAEIIARISIKYGLAWTDESMLDIACTYIDNQDDDAAFRDFVEQRAKEEASY